MKIAVDIVWLSFIPVLAFPQQLILLGESRHFEALCGNLRPQQPFSMEERKDLPVCSGSSRICLQYLYSKNLSCHLCSSWHDYSKTLVNMESCSTL